MNPLRAVVVGVGVALSLSVAETLAGNCNMNLDGGFDIICDHNYAWINLLCIPPELSSCHKRMNNWFVQRASGSKDHACGCSRTLFDLGSKAVKNVEHISSKDADCYYDRNIFNEDQAWNWYKNMPDCAKIYHDIPNVPNQAANDTPNEVTNVNDTLAQ